MKNFILQRKNIIITLLFILCAGLLCPSFIFLNLSSARAEQLPTQLQLEIQLPNTEEYKSLVNPTDVYYFDGNYAIIHNGQSELLYFDSAINQYRVLDTGLTNLKQVNKYDEQTLIVLGNTSPTLIKYDLKTNAKEQLSFSGNFFDVVDNNIVTTFNTHLSKYTDFNLDTSFINSSADGNYPVKANKRGDIFYISNTGKLMKTDLNCTSPIEVANVAPSIFTVNNNYLFYYYNNELRRIDLLNFADDRVVNLPLSQFQLGKFSQISSLSFKGDNLLITDAISPTNNAIQEFEVVEENSALHLKFTGFAIAKNLTAYNRIANSVKEIEKLNGTTATLDQNKLTLVKSINNEKQFINYIFEKAENKIIDQTTYALKVETPDSFALGAETALIYKNGALSTQTHLLNLQTGALQTVDGLYTNRITDICYQNGFYYFLTQGSNNLSGIYSMREGTYLAVPICENLPSLTSNERSTPPLLTVDIYANIYATDRINDKIIKIFLQDGVYTYTTLDLPATNAIKLQTDLNGEVFVLYSNNELKCIKNGQTCQFDLTAKNTEGQTSIVNSFAFDYIEKSVNFTAQNEEIIFSTSLLNNESINNLSEQVLYNYVTNGQNAKPLDQTNYYTPLSSTPIFSLNILEDTVNYIDTLSFENLTFVELGNIKSSDQTYLLLAGLIDNKVYTILVNQGGATIDDTVIKDCQNEYAYTSTAVDMYYLPIITKPQTYCIVNNESVTRLKVKSKILTQNVVTFAERDFYFASAIVNENVIYGYVPVGFTTKELYESYPREDFSIEKVSQAKVYADNQLTNEVTTLSKDTVIKVYQTLDGVSKIGYYNQNGKLTYGFIDANCIAKLNFNTIRNVIIIFCVLTCVAVTSLFFIRTKIKK